MTGGGTEEEAEYLGGRGGGGDGDDGELTRKSSNS